MRATLSAATIFLFVNAVPCAAAISLQPGEWQSTETGTENGQPVKPEVEKSCMSEAEARDATSVVKQMKEQMQGQGGQCEKLDIQQNGNSVTFGLKCAMGQQFLMDMTGTFTFISSTKYSGALKSSIKMGTISSTSDKKIEAMRIGECKTK